LLSSDAASLIQTLNETHTTKQALKNSTFATTATTTITNQLNSGSFSYAELLFTTRSNIGWVFGTAMPTGWALVLVLLVMVIFSMPCVRKKGYFKLFYLSHKLYVLFLIILFLHGSSFWKWFLLSAVMLVLETCLAHFCIKSKKYGDTYIRDVHLLSSKVTHLVIKRPLNFKFCSGDYVFIRIPKLSRYEWHPFTISSAPELKDELWLHVRSLGDWTNKLYDWVQEFTAKSDKKFEKKVSNLVVSKKHKTNRPSVRLLYYCSI
jgi:hypothetical protein